MQSYNHDVCRADAAHRLNLMYAGRDYILPSAAVYLVLVPLYVKARREVGEAKAFTPFELVVLAALAAMTVAFAVQLATGTSAF